MAKYNKNDEPLRRAKQWAAISYDMQKSEERKLQQMNALKNNRIVYYSGYKYGLDGGNLAMVDDKYKDSNGEVTRVFKQGYIKGINHLGFDMAVRKTHELEEFPHLSAFKEFMDGYQGGIDYLESKPKTK